MDEREALIAIRDILRENLEDPMFQWTGKTRNYIHDDDPLAQSTFPRIQITQRGPSSSEIISCGCEFWEWYTVVFDIHFITQLKFKWKDSNDNYLSDQNLCKAYATKIWDTIKAQCRTLKLETGITGLKMMSKTTTKVDADTQFQRGITSVRVWFFDK